MYERENDLTCDDIIPDEDVALASECDNEPKIYEELPGTPEDMEKVVLFVKNDIDKILSASSWENINQEPYIGNLSQDFSIYHRQTALKDILKDSADDFTNYPTLNSIRSKRKTFAVGCDAEWTYYKEKGLNKRFILSWQWAYINDGYVHELVFLVKNLKNRLKLNDALGVVWANGHSNSYKSDSIKVEDIRTYGVSVLNKQGVLVPRYFKKRSEAVAACGDKRVIVPVDNIDKKVYRPITVIFHFGIGDLFSFNRKGLNKVYKGISCIQKGMVSMQPIKINAELKDANYTNHRRIYPFLLSIRDTACHTPAKHRSLKDLGEVIGVEKKYIDEKGKSRMDKELIKNPIYFLEYASIDSVITLLYSAQLYGENMQPPVTLTSATSSVMRETIAESLKIDTSEKNWKETFNNVYRGIEMVASGTKANYGEEIPFIQGMEAQPINLDTHDVVYMASLAYHGGYNGCSMPGFYDELTLDFDLRNAYPTSMCLCKDSDFSNPIAKRYDNCYLSDIAEEIFKEDGATSMVFAEIESFSFPEDTPFPCIVVKVEDIPIYPLTYKAESVEFTAANSNESEPKMRTSAKKKKIKRVCTTGPELWLAHQFGAKVFIKRAYLLRTLKVHDEDGNEIDSMSLSSAVKQFVVDRNAAKAVKKDGICDTLLKVMICSMYGKTAQNVKPKKTYSAEEDATISIGPSSITSPILAAQITAIVRCVLIAAQTEIVKNGFKTYSVTTDGQISNIDLETLKSFKLYGFAEKMREARLFLTDGKDRDFWEVKHWQGGDTPGLLNFATRGNVSLRCNDKINDAKHPDGVCAHCGVTSGYIKDSYDDRKWLTEKILTRTSKISYIVKLWTTFKELVTNRRKKINGIEIPEKCAVDFEVIPIERKSCVDFDLKRKPVRNSFKTVEPIIDGKKYEIADFETAPYKDADEFLLYRNQGKWLAKETDAHSSKCLRTTYDWETYFWPGIEMKQKIAERKASGNYTPSKKAPPKKHNSIFTRKVDYAVDRKIRNCLYAYRAGFIDIPLITDHSPVEFLYVLNKSGISHRRFDLNDYKNYGKVARLPRVLKSGDSHIIKHFLEAQEPVLNQLKSLTYPEELTSPDPFDDI